jgi:allophanate hydrolase
VNKLSVRGLVDDFKAGRRRPRDVLEAVYASIEARGRAPVWIALEPFEKALEKLEIAERRAEPGSLFGVPFGVKDNIDVAGLPTTAACPAFEYVPERSAAVVERLTRAGAIVIGKTNLDQFATGLVGTRTPYGICSSVFGAEYISGGSSSGSAVAVARGDVAFSLGTDTAGSGRVPAAFNGLIGLKPTPGLFSARGVVPACRSLDCVSIFAHTLDDASDVFDVAAGYDEEDPFSRRAPVPEAVLGAHLRVGIPTRESLEFFGDGESARLFDEAIARLRRVGAELVSVDLGPFRETAGLLYTGPWVAERLVATERLLAENPDALEPTVRRIVSGGRDYRALDVFQGLYRLAALRRVTHTSLAGLDALLLPTAPTHYRIEDVLKDPLTLNANLGTYTNFVNLLDLSALALPSGFRENGLPFGVTFVAPSFRDRALLALARRFHAAPAAATDLTLSAQKEPVRPPRGRVWLAVAGAHLTGQPLNGELTSRGARHVTTTRTAVEYRLYALATSPPKPGLTHTPGQPGYAIEVEVWELDEPAFGSFVAAVSAPMTIGTTRLEDGSVVKGFACEPYAIDGAKDISSFGGWRAYLAQGRA